MCSLLNAAICLLTSQQFTSAPFLELQAPTNYIDLQKVWALYGILVFFIHVYTLFLQACFLAMLSTKAVFAVQHRQTGVAFSQPRQ